MNVIDEMIRKLEEAKRSALLEKASFGFPADRIQVTSIHFGDGVKVGDCFHPTDYVKRTVALHHATWIVGPIDSVIETLRLHAETLEATQQLTERLASLNIDGLLQRARAGRQP